VLFAKPFIGKLNKDCDRYTHIVSVEEADNSVPEHSIVLGAEVVVDPFAP